MAIREPWHGRRYAPDRRDKKHLLAPKRSAKAIISRTWRLPIPALDQGPTSMCVGFSCYAYLRAAPVYNTPPFNPAELYTGAKMNDEFRGTRYEGSSVRGGFKFLHRMRYIKEYKWAFDCEAVVDHLLTVGPVVMGTDWFKKMDDTDKHGYIWPEGGKPTGHAYLLNHANREQKNPDGTFGAAGMIQSWGAWGIRNTGRAMLTFEALDYLIKAEGEAAVGHEIRVGAAHAI